MSALVVKALCRRIEARYGSNRNAAMAAGVSPSVWSNYCSDEQPDTTIPFHRLLLVANTAERDAFVELLLGEDAPPPASIMTEACETTESSAELLREVREAQAPDSPGGATITPLEQKRIRQRAVGVQAAAGDVLRAVS